jgi:hypothetical protein
MAQTAWQQLMTMRTIDDSALTAHASEVAKQSYQPDVLIMAAGNLTTSGCCVALDDDDVENKGERVAIRRDEEEQRLRFVFLFFHH